MVTAACCVSGANAGICADDVTTDLCSESVTPPVAPPTTTAAPEGDESSAALRGAGVPILASAIMLASTFGVSGGGGSNLLAPLMLSALLVPSQATDAHGAAAGTTCLDVKNAYKSAECCDEPEKAFQFDMVPNPTHRLQFVNQCAGTKPDWPNTVCETDGAIVAMEQAGGDVTEGFQGTFDVGDRVPIPSLFHNTAMCPVNVHWHLGAEHRSQGEFDEDGKSPHIGGTPLEGETLGDARTDAGHGVRYGFACHHYNADDVKFTTPYAWKHCEHMHVGETYEVHWPHSSLGACGTVNQYQSPFYDGVFCHYDGAGAHAGLTHQDIANNIGVESQVFTIVNDEHFFYPDLIRGMMVGGDFGANVGKYTGSTTGTSRDNTVCSSYKPITWQVDRKCHLISASSFDKMCADMKQQNDDMSGDIHPHGARELVATNLTASNLDATAPPAPPPAP